MSVKQHYDDLLGDVYAWMSGDFDAKLEEVKGFFRSNGIVPFSNSQAIDLGAGHGIQSVALAQLGFKVKAVDFNRQLLEQLRMNVLRHQADIDVLNGDLREVKRFADPQPELILCWGDTILHLSDRVEVKRFISECFSSLSPGGKLLISFRDYTEMRHGADRFIPVKSDDNMIMTCCIDYGDAQLTVNDILHIRRGNQWELKVSSYQKLRILPQEMLRMLEKTGFLKITEVYDGKMLVMIAEKP